MNNPVAEILVFTDTALPALSGVRPTTHRKAAAMPANGQTPRLRVVSSRGAHENSAPAAASSPASLQALFETNLPVVESVVRFVCHRQRLNSTQADEFASEVMLRLVENDYDILRRFEHRSSLRTYLTVVIQRMFLDYRNRLWGKWRPSAEALRLGPVAIRLERLLSREGYDFDQACEVLHTNEGVTLSRSELADMAARLPVRTRFSLVGEEALDMLSQDHDSADASLSAREPRAIGLRIRRALGPAVQGMSDQDRLILRLRFQDGLGVVEIARALNLEQKPLYRRFEALLRRLRNVLEAEGIDRDAARDAVERKDVDISLALLAEVPRKVVPMEARPSTGGA